MRLIRCGWTDGEVPFVRSTPEVIDRMLELAQVKPSDLLYDIGSGDGAIVIRAAKKYGVKGVGIEIDQDLVTEARATMRFGKMSRILWNFAPRMPLRSMCRRRRW